MRAYLETPTKIYLQITNTCSLNCRQCYTRCEGGCAPTDLTTSEWLTLADKLFESGIMHVYFEGGEPLSRPDFIHIAEYFSRKALVWMRTHATTLTPDIAFKLSDARVSLVSVDIFSDNAAEHDFLSGVVGSFNRTLEGISNLIHAGIDVVLICIVNAISIRRLQGVVNLASTLGVGKVGLFRLYPLGRARENWLELSVSPRHATKAIAELNVPIDIKVMQSWHPNNGNCCWENAGITSDGRSIGCPYLREYVDFGNIREISFLETWQHPLYKRLRSGPVQSGACGECASREGRAGGCRAAAYAFHRDWSAHDPYCEFMGNNVDITQITEFPGHSESSR